MDESELKNISSTTKNGENMLIDNLLVCEPEIEAIQSQVNKYVDEVEALVKQNRDTKRELAKIKNQLEDKRVELEGLEAENRDLEAKAGDKLISSKKVGEILYQKIK